MIIADLWNAVKFGEQLDSPEKWKRGQLLSNAVGGLILIVVNHLPPEYKMTPDMIQAANEVISGILILINGYITKASSNKI